MPEQSGSLALALDAIRGARERVPREEAVLVALSGIDGSGKGYVAARLVEGLRALGLRTASINVDAWLRLPEERFDAERPGEHFYRRAIRFEEMLEAVVLPLKRRRSVRAEVDAAEETATSYVRRTVAFDDVDVVVLEGVFLLRRDLRRHFDLALWVDCSFDTALVRALRRVQEGLPFDETIRVYRTIYFPAQFVHLALDDPRAAADLIVDNDAV